MRILTTIGVFFLATIVAYVVILFGYGWYADTFQVHDFEGATAMGVAFAIAPAGAILVGIIAAVWFGIRLSRRKASP